MPLFKRGFAPVLAALAMLFLLPGAAQAKWLKAESPRFIIYSDGGESDLREYIEDMEVFDSLLRSRHGLPENGVPARKLPIYLVSSRDELQRTWHKASDGIAGYYSPGSADVFAVAVLEGEDFTLLHEYVHHFMLANFPGAYPAWMVEGYAEYYSTVVIKDQYVEVGAPNQQRSYELTDASWLPIGNVLGNKLRDDGRDTFDFYAESWLLTHYMMSSPERFKQFQTYASAVGRGGDPVASMEAATGIPLAEFDKTIRKYKSARLAYTRFKRTDFTRPPITITVLPASADALLLERLQLIHQSAKLTDPGYLGMVRARAARFPDDELAMVTLGRAELEIGDKAKGKALIDAWIAAHPDDVEGRYLLGANLLYNAMEEKDPEKSKAMWAEARPYLEAAARLAPNDYRVLLACAQARRGEAGYPSLETQTLLVTAYKQAPQVTPLRFELIQVLMARKNWPQAEALLKPLVNSPHGGEVADKARELLKRVQAARAAG